MSDEQSQWSLQIPFWIDIDAYTPRDREMFVCGVEFQMVCHLLESGERIERPIHRENESRIRMLCGKFKRKYDISQHHGYEGCETWSSLVIEEN